MNKILIVEDDESINNLIFEYLSKEGNVCTSAFSGTEGKLLLAQEPFDLVLLDLMLPGIRGEDLIKIIKSEYQIPVIILSAKDSINSKVDLLKSGADDYICKPFDLLELAARVQVQFRNQKQVHIQGAHEFKGLSLGDDMRSVTYEGKIQNLTKHEYRIMQVLMRNPQRAYTKRDIYEYAWEEDYLGDDKTINVHMSNLRGKLAKLSEQEFIETIWGIGFKLKA